MTSISIDVCVFKNSHHTGMKVSLYLCGMTKFHFSFLISSYIHTVLTSHCYLNLIETATKIQNNHENQGTMLLQYL